MELRQLRSLVTLIENDFSVIATANELCIVQSAVSQHISRLEEEIGTPLLVRKGKRLTGLTETGGKVEEYARRVLADTRSILEVGLEQTATSGGVLRVGATHTQARYVLPSVIHPFRDKHPDINFHIHQGTPEQLVDMALKGLVDLSICTEALSDHKDLTTLPCYSWNRGLIALPSHPIAKLKNITLEALCEYPLITYVFGLAGRNHFNNTFSSNQLSPNIVLGAADTDVIKTYVREGLGIGIIANMAYSEDSDADLIHRNLSDLFPRETTKIAYQKDRYLRQYQKDFIEIFREVNPSQ